jgi:hypothetical protein
MTQSEIASNPSGNPDIAKVCSEKLAFPAKITCTHAMNSEYKPIPNALFHIHMGHLLI